MIPPPLSNPTRPDSTPLTGVSPPRTCKLQKVWPVLPASRYYKPNCSFLITLNLLSTNRRCARLLHMLLIRQHWSIRYSRAQPFPLPPSFRLVCPAINQISRAYHTTGGKHCNCCKHSTPMSARYQPLRSPILTHRSHSSKRLRCNKCGKTRWASR